MLNDTPEMTPILKKSKGEIFLKNRYTIVVMSSADGSVRQHSIGHWSLKLLYLVGFIVVASAIGFFIMVAGTFGKIGWGVHSTTHIQSISDENQSLKVSVKSQQNQLNYLDKEMRRIREMADMVSRVMGLDEQKGTGILGQGGDGFGTEDVEPNEHTEFGFETGIELVSDQLTDKNDSPATRIAELKKRIEPVYKYAIESVEVLNQTPSILPVQVPMNKQKKSHWYSSGFGYRSHPLTKRREFHSGLDISVGKNISIIATANGVISKVERDKFLGRMIEITHEAKQIKTLYGHMSKFADEMQVGKKVKRGEVIGFVGSSGRSTGPHLHYGVYLIDQERWVNPRAYILND